MTDLRVRRATPADRPAIVALQTAAHGEPERWGCTALLDEPTVGPARFTVAEDDGEIVSALCLLSRTLRYRHGSTVVDLPMGQPEYVATAPEHRGRGLIRRQIDEVHQWSTARGDLAQVITGIPYFYRRFGYEYAIGIDEVAPIVDVAMPAGWRVRRATPRDLERCMALEDGDLATLGVALLRDRRAWRRFTSPARGRAVTTYVATCDGEVRAVGQAADWGERSIEAGNVAALEPEGARALLAAIVRDAGPRPVRVLRRPGTVGAAALDGITVPVHQWGVYVRVPDPVALLDAIRPVLSARLADSPLARWSGELAISLYRDGIRVVADHGEVVKVASERGEEDPFDTNGVGVAPDLIATLIFGRYGALELERRHDDVGYGYQRALMATLFPAMTAGVPSEV